LNIEVVSIILSIISIFISLFSLQVLRSMIKYSIDAKIEVEAMRKSTHTIQYVDPMVDKPSKDWATSPESIDKQNKAYTEEIEAEMPEFNLSDEDKKIFSY
jgi:hypothetical protein